MKGLIKRLLKAVWNATSPVRRPLILKLDRHFELMMTRSIDSKLSPLLGRLETAIASNHETVTSDMNLILMRIAETARDSNLALNSLVREAGDTNLVLNGMVREVARLEAQIEILQLSDREFSGFLVEDAPTQTR